MSEPAVPWDDDEYYEAMQEWVAEITELAEQVPNDMQTPLRHVERYRQGRLDGDELQDRLENWQRSAVVTDLMNAAEKKPEDYIDE